MEGISDLINKTYGNRLRLRACGICIQEHEVLMVKHEALTEKGYFWSPPGGGIQFGETVEQCLSREFIEETGLKIAVSNFLFVHEFIALPLHAVELFFAVHITGGILHLGSDPEMENKQTLKEVKYMSEEDIRVEKGIQLHNIFNYCSSINELLALRGYFKFDNNTRY